MKTGTEDLLKSDHAKLDAMAATLSREDKLRNCGMRVAILSQGRGLRPLSSVQHPVHGFEATATETRERRF